MRHFNLLVIWELSNLSKFCTSCMNSFNGVLNFLLNYLKLVKLSLCCLICIFIYLYYLKLIYLLVEPSRLVRDDKGVYMFNYIYLFVNPIASIFPCLIMYWLIIHVALVFAMYLGVASWILLFNMLPFVGRKYFARPILVYVATGTYKVTSFTFFFW